MPDFSVNFTHVALIALANFLLSWFWYSNLGLGKAWAHALKWPKDRMQTMSAADKKRMPLLMGMGLLSSYLKILVLAAFVAGFNAQSFLAGVMVGLLAWLGFTLTASLDTLWEGRSGQVLLINNGLFALTYSVFGGILALWR